MLNRGQRVERTRSEMESLGIDWLIVSPGTNLEYLFAVKRRLAAYTRVDHHGSWAEMALLNTRGEVFYIAPRMVADFESVDQQGVAIKRLEEEQPIEPQLVRILSEIGLTSGRIAVEDILWSRALIELQRILPDVQIVPADALFSHSRMVKDKDELETLRRAGEITDAAFGEVLRVLRPGMSERDIAVELEFQLLSRGAEAFSFPPWIFTCHENRPGDLRSYRAPQLAPLDVGTVIAFDFGCVFEGYCTDFGRTVVLGEPSSEVRKFHTAVVNAAQSGIDALAAGASACHVHRTVCGAMQKAGYGELFIHRTGHGIGMDAHEDPSLDSGESCLLEEGMVFTIEPSVIVDGSLWVRTEDVVIVGKDRGTPVTRFPSELIIV